MAGRNYKPTSALLRRIQKMRQKQDLSPKEDGDLEYLMAQRQTEIETLLPKLTCCQSILDYRVVKLYVDTKDGDEVCSGPPVWKLRSDSNVYIEMMNRTRGNGRDPYEEPPVVKFCPFCGTPVPPLRRKDPPPPDLCQGIDGSGYCARCGERCMCCLCDPPSAAFEVGPPCTG